ncbi:hypothetical protein [Sphingomonas arenae]|uniref:hypothetical protein n=1 Tax=Sphingomonas arenae TaxID=2812555 RepID=UPI001966CF30|nr:hypothetical protein [Sphingomonas arenae]
MPESLDQLRHDLGARLAEIRTRADRLSPLDMHRRMDAIRDEAGRAGLSALEGLAGRTAQMALLPGCRVTVPGCLAHAADAVASGSSADRQTILAAIAVRMH